MNLNYALGQIQADYAILSHGRSPFDWFQHNHSGTKMPVSGSVHPIAHLRQLFGRIAYLPEMPAAEGLGLRSIQSAKMNEVDPLAWLTQTLQRIAAGWPSSDLDALMPWNFKK